MTVTWIIEQDVFNEVCYDKMITHFKQNSIPFKTVRIIPFIHEVEGKTPAPDTKNVVCYGSIGIQKLAKKQNWNPGVWTNDNFNSGVYSEKLGDLFLNNTTEIMLISEVISKVQLDEFFIKPNSDDKEFAGQVMLKTDFAEWYQKMIDIGYLESNDFEVAISCPIDIADEYRLVVVNNKIIAGSIYKRFGRVMPKEGWLPEFQDIINDINWSPADVYVVDMGLTEDGWKVIEYNTFNSSGFYECNVADIIDSINEYLNEL